MDDADNTSNSYVDITDKFKASCSLLEVGELAHSHKFYLQDAMSAIEIMDPKMDAGVQMPRRVVYLKEALESKMLQLKDFEPTEVLGIMDESLAAMVNWLEGDTLAQTVFINMYMHCINLIEDKPLRTFCEGLKKLIVFIKSIISKTAVYEEEDICLSANGMPLDLDDISDPRVTGLLREADEELNKEIRKGTENSDVLTAIQFRLRFIRSMLLLILQLNKAIECDRQVTVGQVQQESRKYVEQLTTLCTSITETLPLGKPAPGKDNPRELPYGLAGFEPFLNQPLLPPTIPRYRRIIDRVESMQYCTELVQRLKHILDIFHFDSSDQLHVVWDFIRRFSQFGVNGKSCILTRSLLLLLYLPPNKGKVLGIIPKIDVFKESLKNFTNLSVWSMVQKSFTSPAVKDQLDLLCKTCTAHLFELPLTYSFNRSRQRNRLEQMIETTWDLYEECTKGDYILKEFVHQIDPKLNFPPIFCSYIAFFLFEMMWEYLIIGFELELYVLHELPYVFNFLNDCVLYNYALHLTEMERCQHADRQNKKIAGRKGRRAKEREGSLEQKLPVSGQLIIIRCHYSLTSGTLYALCAFMRDSKLNVPQLPFGTEETRYIRRFAPLLNCGWFAETGSYRRYRAVWEDMHRQSVEHLYQEAMRFFEAARKWIDEAPPNILSGLESLNQVAKNNMVICKLLGSGHKRGPESSITLDFNSNTSMIFPMFKLG